jgi:hypothetical protein
MQSLRNFAVGHCKNRGQSYMILSDTVLSGPQEAQKVLAENEILNF